MNKQEIDARYAAWCEHATRDPDLAADLATMRDDETAKEDAFYCDLAFGTAGLRGVIGAGTNRMNIYTVGRATEGLSAYILAHFPPERRSVAISYDSRIKSDLFARTAAGIFAANGITVYIYPALMPVPCLSYAVRTLHCAAGVMITASHNPSKYNGYKAYGPDGCQIAEGAADEILACIDRVDLFRGIPFMDFEEGVRAGRIHYTDPSVEDGFIREVLGQTMLAPGEKIDRDVAIVYSPLNGAGLHPVLRALTEAGFTNVTVVKEQEQPDGRFPTCPYPNPEIREAMALGMEYAAREKADLLLATDPDCDRVGIAVRNTEGDYVLLTGNETGLLLLDYICSRRRANGTMPKDPVLVKTVVTTDLADRIAASYGVRTINVLTGFKFIGEQIARLEAAGHPESYILGFEESYGYLSGTYVRDKDAVNASFLICEMFAYYKTHGVGLYEKLQEIYRTHGYCLNTLRSFAFEGAAGFDKMRAIMQAFRAPIAEIGGHAVENCVDYAKGIDGLPCSDVLKFHLAGNCSVVVRPSGTEPKLKLYISVSAKDHASALRETDGILNALKGYFA